MLRSRRHRLGPALAFALASIALAGAARADIAPGDACSGAEGSACKTAGASFNSPGTCVTMTCTRTLPPAMPGGPPQTVQSACQRCVANGEEEEGCSYGGPGGAPGTMATLALASAGLWFARRRRR